MRLTRIIHMNDKNDEKNNKHDHDIEINKNNTYI